MHDDIEGMGLYHSKTKVIWWFQAKAMTALWCLMPLHLTRFVAHLYWHQYRKGIDAVSETDGLDVSSLNFGGKWKRGMLVIQDGRKRMPETNQNFKYVPWEKSLKRCIWTK